MDIGKAPAVKRGYALEDIVSIWFQKYTWGNPEEKPKKRVEAFQNSVKEVALPVGEGEAIHQRNHTKLSYKK